MHTHKLFQVAAALLAAGLLVAATAADRYVAGYELNTDAVIDTIANAGGKVIANYPQIRTIIAESDRAEFAAAVSRDSNFQYVAKDVEVMWIPNPQVDAAGVQSLAGPGAAPQGDPWNAGFFYRQWNMIITQTLQAWQQGFLGSPQVKVAVLDTGICAHHQDLAGKVDAGQSAAFVAEDRPCWGGGPTPNCPGCPAWEDYYFHGTHVAGIVSTNNIGTAGMAPNVRLRAVKVLRCTGSGPFSAVIQGIMYAVDTGNDVINMSLGAGFYKNAGPGPGSLGLLVAALNKAVNYAQTEGVLVVSAAGNESYDMDKDRNVTFVPCQSGSGVCVGGTTNTDALATYSNHGVSGPQLAAPGGGSPYSGPWYNRYVWSPCSYHSLLIPACGTIGPIWYLGAYGTSMAAPHVAGAAALVDSIAPAGPGSQRAGQLRNALLKGADDLGKPGTDNIYSQGRLNTLRALQ